MQAVRGSLIVSHWAGEEDQYFAVKSESAARSLASAMAASLCEAPKSFEFRPEIGESVKL